MFCIVKHSGQIEGCLIFHVDDVVVGRRIVDDFVLIFFSKMKIFDGE